MLKWQNVTIALALLTAAIALTSSAVMAINNYHFFLPVVETWQYLPPELQIISRSLTYNSTLMQYTEAKLDIQNIGGSDHTAKVELKFYDNYGAKIAEGNLANTGTISSGITLAVTIPLVWQPGYTVANLTRTDVQVIQTS